MSCFPQDMKFSVFMASFNAAVGIPPDRAGESVFEFDGSKLSPTGTAEVREDDWQTRSVRLFLRLSP